MVASPSSSVLSSSSSSLTPTSSTPSTCTITPATYAAANATTASTSPLQAHRPYPLSASPAHAGGAPARTTPGAISDAGTVSPGNSSRMPVTPAVLRAIFASSRSPAEERSLSRIAFFRFSGFIISCLAISLMANQGRGIRTGAALLGVGV
ncbi:hypothetical protein BC827DRAFT_1181583 [Russula dissimulans]|nr:hypothetical protein BC827DRAFT_1181583 [Russula dissimulans]